MGVEEFKIALHSSLSQTEAEACLLREAGSSLEENVGDGIRHMLISGNEHVFEIEIRPEAEGSRVTLSLALCHPDVALRKFVDWTTRACLILGVSSVSIMEDLPPEIDVDFPPAPTDRLVASLLAGLGIKRDAWRVEFGETEAVVTGREALRMFVIRGKS